MQIDSQTGLLSDVEYHQSSNQDKRPDADDITGIVIHSISLPPGEFGGGWIDDLFLNKLNSKAHPYFAEIADIRVSAHLLIKRSGETIQYVPFNQCAWHAGVSAWDNRERCNDFTIGIELEGCGDSNFEKVQYQQLTDIIKLLCDTYPKLTIDNIRGHEDIAPGRKTDPGPNFNWTYLNKLLLQA